jgi:hypothetical protein
MVDLIPWNMIDTTGRAAGAVVPTIDLATDFGIHPGDGNDYASEVQTAWDQAGDAKGARIWCSDPGGGTDGGQIILDGPLQDTGGANAQIIIPAISAVAGEQVSIEFWGNQQPPQGFSVVGATPPPKGHLHFESTIAGAAGGAVFGAKGPVGSFDDFTFVHQTLRNVGIRLPSNSPMTALDFSRVACVDLDRVVVDQGGYYVQGFTQPTTASSYGIKMPKNNNGAFSTLDKVAVAGFYTGYQFAEHAFGGQVNAWGCLRAAEFAAAANHGSIIARFMAVHCPTGLVVTGSHAFRILQYAIEHATTGWWAPVVGTNYDIDDVSNYGEGGLEYRVVKAGVGPDHTFAKHGGTGITAIEIGTAAGGASLTVKDEGTSIDTAVTSINFVGSGVTATTDGTGHTTATIPGASVSAGELAVMDGVTNPPELAYNDAGDDFVYLD